MPHLKVEQFSIPYYLIRSKRARKLRLEWLKSEARIVAPLFCTNQIILNFLRSQSEWLVKQQKRATHDGEMKPHLWPKLFHEGAIIPYLGVPLKVSIKLNQRISKVSRVNREIVVQTPSDDIRKAEKILIHWLKEKALRLALRWVHSFCVKLERQPRSVRVKYTKRQWGSCGIHDDIFLNWQLVCFPLSVFKYVVLHECCHLKYRNHGPRFWGLVEKYMPSFKAEEKWLRKVSPWDVK